MKFQQNKTFSHQLINLHASSGMCASFLAYGATLYSLLVPDRHGNLIDVVLGYRDLSRYQKNPDYFGATIGRNANRIKGGQFELNGASYQLAKNDGENNLHSNPGGFDKRLWQAEIFARDYVKGVRFSLVSPAGDCGFPGNLRACVTYTLHDDNSLEVLYHATCDNDTLFNPTNHAYFNLDGEASGNAMNQLLWINASRYTPVDENLIPTGEIAPLDGTPLDFRCEKAIRKDLKAEFESMRAARGFDHNYVLNDPGKLRPVATLRSELNGIKTTLITDRPGLQFYCGGVLDGSAIGKSGKPYQQYAGVCLETQTFPDAIHHRNFPSPILKSGAVFETHTIFHFETLLI